MEHELPADQLETARVKVDQLLAALRENTRLTPDVESALVFRPEPE